MNIHSLLAYQSLTDTIVYQDDKKISLQQLIDDLSYLDKILPESQYLLNLFEDRYYFLLGLLLGIKRNAIHLFPANTSPYTLEFLEKKYSQILILNNTDSGGNKAAFINIEQLLREKITIDNSISLSLGDFFNKSFINEKRVIIFTSGSTGDPKPFTKNWSDFITLARQLARPLALQHKPVILATVPAQHMYGLETSIIMPLVNGLSIYAGRPFYPADIEAILAKQRRSTLLITTPVHIRACLKTKVTLPFLQGVLSATAPLDANMAKLFEQQQNTSLVEIYGCTEVGVIATRQTAREKYWSCLADIELKKSSDGDYNIKTQRSIQTFILNDYICEAGDNRFLLNGRKADIINLAGKRTSLSYLNHHLLAHKDIIDGCFYQPDDASNEAQQRLIVFIVADNNTFTIKQLKEYLKIRIEPVFLPRRVYFIKQLPRNKTGKILSNDIKSLYQAVTFNTHNTIVDTKADTMPNNDYSFTIAHTHPCFAGHFPDNPVVPGAVVLEQVILKWGVFSKHKILSIDFAKFMQPVLADISCFVCFNPVKARHSAKMEFVVKTRATSIAERGKEIILCKGRLVHD